MISEEKIKQVKKQLRAGVPEGEIKNSLLEEGYSEEDLENIFVAHKPDMQSWYLISAILFLIFGLYNIIVNSSLLFLIFSGTMFVVYYLELVRIKKQSS